MKITKLLALFFSPLTLLLSAGCAFGPLVNTESARTVGASNHELVGGYGIAGYVFKWTYGVSENIDIGLQWESLSIGVRAKYAFLNQPEGWSLAGALGTGSSLGGNHTYADLITSYMTGSWEPYGTIRFVHVTTDPVDFNDTNTGQVHFTVHSAQYNYGHLFFGTRYWFTPHLFMAGEISTLFPTSSDFKIDSNPIVTGINLGYRW